MGAGDYQTFTQQHLQRGGGAGGSWIPAHQCHQCHQCPTNWAHPTQPCLSSHPQSQGCWDSAQESQSFRCFIMFNKLDTLLSQLRVPQGCEQSLGSCWALSTRHNYIKVESASQAFCDCRQSSVNPPSPKLPPAKETSRTL